MAQQTGTYLDRIVADKREELAQSKRQLPLQDLRDRLPEAPPVRPFLDALRGDTISLIAEVKRASPSRGLLREDFDPVGLASAYQQGGAAAISVLTDAKYFQGSLEHLRSIRATSDAVPPLLRKDFLFDPYQLYEARFHGGDAALLIAAVLEPSLLAELIALATSLGLTALVEVHQESELEQALAAGAKLIGINNRDLRTFEVDLATTERLCPSIPAGILTVAESGVHNREDVLRLQSCGVNALLIGEALVTAPDPRVKIRELFPHAG
ncbi:MAG TPA: indole-3-glycerol phosphate synthase TrpC [Dehalococcoidia bacterium]|nr:indole-3-glycerol phosphate synthase TrpC [Dehalococcoidia bacterium]